MTWQKVIPICVLSSISVFVLDSGRPASAQDSNSTAVREHPLIRPIKYARAAQARIRAFADYEATFTKKEAIERRLQSSTMRVRIRHAPFSVFMEYIDPHKGRQVSYVKGQNDGKLHVKQTGLMRVIGTLTLSPDDPRAMKDNRHPITSMGIDRSVEKVIQRWELESKYGEIDVKYYGNAVIRNPEGDIACRVIESSHPRPRRQFEFQKTRLYLRKSDNLPIRIEHFAFPLQEGDKSPLVEQYTYTKIKTNRGFTDRDFSF